MVEPCEDSLNPTWHLRSIVLKDPRSGKDLLALFRKPYVQIKKRRLLRAALFVDVKYYFKEARNSTMSRSSRWDRTSLSPSSIPDNPFCLDLMFSFLILIRPSSGELMVTS